MKQFTIGADPELFLMDTTGKLISSVGLIGGTKEAPLPISEVGHAIQEDNVSVEFNIPASDSCREFIEHLDFVMSHLHHKAKGLNLQFAENVAAGVFSIDQLQTPEAMLFGCEPDYNAWTGKVNPRPHAEDARLRSCGGHVHVGTDLDPYEVVKAMDIFLGVPSVELDSDKLRRELYGKAGACRVKPYGVEYRTLSNFWIWKKELREWVYQQTQRAIDYVASGRKVAKTHKKIVQQAINLGDPNAVAFLKTKYSV